MSTGAASGAGTRPEFRRGGISGLWFAAYAGLIILSCILAFRWDSPLLFGTPLLVLTAYVAIVDFRKLFYLLFALIPLSFEYVLPNGLGIDLPDEPLMWLLTGLGLLFLCARLDKLSARFVLHPITLLLLLHLCWFVMATIQAQSLVFAFKFLAAKIWYVVAFYCMSYYILRSPRDRDRLFWLVLVPLLITVIIVFVREAMIGFAFGKIHFVMGPFYRNHVAYASIIALFMPFLWNKIMDSELGGRRRMILLGIAGFFLLALFFSFTRAAMLAVVAAVGFYWVLRWRWMRMVTIGVSLALLLAVAWLMRDNKYLEFAPNFDTTVMHDQFGNLITATYNLEDISTMERVYRWVAGFRMIADRPWFGFGPGNFYNSYRSYTVSSFRTYVSDNPEHSGIHSYYLMTTVEQGVIGGLIFLVFVFGVFLYGERAYHRIQDPRLRREIMAYLLCFFIISVLQIINDLVETDKVGSFFWLSAAMIARIGSMQDSPAAEPKKGIEAAA